LEPHGGDLTKHSPEKFSNAPHMPGVPSLGLTIDRCIRLRAHIMEKSGLVKTLKTRNNGKQKREQQ